MLNDNQLFLEYVKQGIDILITNDIPAEAVTNFCDEHRDETDFFCMAMTLEDEGGGRVSCETPKGVYVYSAETKQFDLSELNEMDVII